MNRLILILSIVVLISCEEKKYGAFEVRGNVANAPQQKVYLQEIPFTGEQPVVLDSATLKDNGDFELRAIAKEEGLYRLMLSGGYSVLLVNDGNNIRLKLDLANYRKYSVDGSAASEELHRLMEQLYRTDSTFFAVRSKIDSLPFNETRDSIANFYSQEAGTILTKRRDILKKFIWDSDSPAAISYALGQFDQSFPVTELKQLVDAAANKYPAHSGLARFKSLIAMQAVPEAPEYALTGQQAPEIRLPTPAGDTLALSSLKGKYVLVDFWASWCGPCRKENPNVVAAFNRFKDKNFTILGVSLDQEKQDWVDAIAKDGLTWHHVSDLKYWDSDVVGLYRFDGIPFNVLLDPSGKIIASGLRGNQLHQKLAELIK